MITGSLIATRCSTTYDVLLVTPLSEKLLSQTSETHHGFIYYLGNIGDRYYVARQSSTRNEILCGDRVIMTYNGQCRISGDNIILADSKSTHRYDADGKLLNTAVNTTGVSRYVRITNGMVLRVLSRGFNIQDFDGKTVFSGDDRHSDHTTDVCVSYTLRNGILRLRVHDKWQLEQPVNFPVMSCKIIDSNRILIYDTLIGTYVASPGSLLQLPNIGSCSRAYIVNGHVYINDYYGRVVYVYDYDMKQLSVISDFRIQRVCDDLLIGETCVYDTGTRTRFNHLQGMVIEQRVQHDRETVDALADHYQSSTPLPPPLVKLVISYL